MSTVDYTEKIDKMLSFMRSWIGLVEGGDMHQSIINVYNMGKDNGAYHMTINDPWCAACVGAAAYLSGLSGTIPIVASCDEIMNRFKERGQWRGKPYIPMKGDIVIYDWDGTVPTDHVGVVSDYNDGFVTVIEGNVNDTVGYREIKADHRNIVGYGHPYDSEKAASYFSRLKSADQKYVAALPMISIGSNDVLVKIAQFFIGIPMKDIDGDFGPETDSKVREYQKKKNLEVDGIIGPETWASFFVE